MANVPSTIWNPKDGIGEYSGITPADIVDPSGNFLVDPSGNQIISTDVTFTNIDDTVWTENPSS